MSRSFQIEDIALFKRKALHWLSRFEVASFLDSNGYAEDEYSRYDGLIAAGVCRELVVPKDSKTDAFAALKDFWEAEKGWLFGFWGYDLKNQIEKLSSKNEDKLDFPDLHFYTPEILIQIQGQNVTIFSEKEEAGHVVEAILKTEIEAEQRTPSTKGRLEIQAQVAEADYLQTVATIKQHILEGDLYEMNYCQQFFVEGAAIQPIALFESLNQISKAPFSVFYKNREQYLLCASPERFLQKRANTLISQPIKGTLKRGESQSEDALLRKQLYHSEKDRAENVMIVDLVRNDLARSCQAGTVQVEELFGIYGFGQVFQMISTIKGELRAETHFIDAIKNAFPMGSMTGAPKVMSMQLIEQYEQARRGLYSGAFGYIDPQGDFDFNVVIRSMLYNAAKSYLSFQVGGAIVYDSNPAAEYAECELKVKGIRAVLSV